MTSVPSPRCRVVVLAGGLVVALCAIPSSDTTGQSPRSAGTSADRAGASKKTVDAERSPREPETSAGGSPTAAPVEQATSYRFIPGQTFAYYVEIRVGSRTRIERF